MDIFGLPTELFQLIAKKLSRDDVNALSRVSQAYRTQCEPIIFYSITLSDQKKRCMRISKSILRRLENPDDSLVDSVRCITIQYTSDSAILPEKSLLRALRNIKTLKSLIWCTWLPVTTEILQCLHNEHPSARLEVLAHERNDLPLDEALISSPQLHTLDIKLSALYDKNFRKPIGKSELGQLKKLLIQGASLKILRLQFEKIKHGSRSARNRFQLYGPSEYDPVIFKFDDQEMLPALKDLVLRDMFSWGEHRAAFNVTAMQGWRDHQDWSMLRTLDLRTEGGEEMLGILTTSISRLQELKISLGFHGYPTNTTIANFLQSAHHLIHLHIECHRELSLGILSLIYHTVSAQLVSLDIELGSYLISWEADQFQYLLSCIPKLEALTLFDAATRTVSGAWTAPEAKLPAEIKVKSLTEAACERRAYQQRSTLDCKSEAHCSATGFWYWIDRPVPPNWLGYTENERAA